MQENQNGRRFPYIVGVLACGFAKRSHLSPGPLPELRSRADRAHSFLAREKGVRARRSVLRNEANGPTLRNLAATLFGFHPRHLGPAGFSLSLYGFLFGLRFFPHTFVLSVGFPLELSFVHYFCAVQESNGP